MQGTILIIDGVATNRIMLKVQLSSAYYHVVQAEGLGGLDMLLRRVRPDLVITAMSLPDGDALAVKRMLLADDALAQTPVIAIAPQNDRKAQLDALRAGIEDVLSAPVDDMILQARIRRQLRARGSTEELELRSDASGAFGFAESQAGFVGAKPDMVANVALVTRDAATGALWRNRLKDRLPHCLRWHAIDDIHGLMNDPAPDAIVVDLDTARPGAGLRLLADLKSRAGTRHAAIVVIARHRDSQQAADALDRGADDLLLGGFCAEELAVRLNAQLAQKARSDRLRDSLRNGLQAAFLDPMTGLHNRRYALPKLADIARQAARNGRGFAVMVADLDHFKQINDRYGHPAGDAVLIEVARRMRAQLRPADMIARVGGEEFLIAMPDVDRADAVLAADRLCRQIDGRPFDAGPDGIPIRVTTSIGIAIAPPGSGEIAAVNALIGQADRALYAAKGAGRNQVTLFRAAA